MSFEICIIESSEIWDYHLLNSCQNSFYMKGSLLKRLDSTLNFKCVKKGDEVLALIPVSEQRIHLPHIYYYGFSFMKKIAQLSSSNQIERKIEIQQQISTGIQKNIREFCFSLNPQIYDIRGLFWSNFNDSNLNLIIEPKYTHSLDLRGKNFNSLMEEFKSVRKQEIRYAFERESLFVTTDHDLDVLVRLYINVFLKKNEVPDDLSVSAIKVIVDELEISNLPFEIIQVCNPSGETVSAALIFKDYDGTVHVPIIGTGKSKYGGSLLYSSIIEWALSKNAFYIDFNGSNSPTRAFFKQSFGGSSRLFFQISRNLND